MDFLDFLASGISLVPIFDEASQLGVGQLAQQAVEATRARVPINTNLGTVLLLAPLAKALIAARLLSTNHGQQRPSVVQLQQCVTQQLSQLSPADAAGIYAAIRSANPGGLGRAPEHDVRDAPPNDLLAAMKLVADVDAVARQYCQNFHDICDRLAKWLRSSLNHGNSMPDAICELQMRWLTAELDGLIVRKAGKELALEARQLAEWALDEWLETKQRAVRWQALDTFLRTDGHRRNPGTTADLIAAAIFVVLTTTP
jgi:triphosphoribosyl-dephospho-CoA synthase